jgi:hypothetical protein
MSQFMNFLQQLSRSAGQNVTGLVDLSTMALRPLGYNVPDEKVFGSTAWAEKKGLLAPADYSASGIAGQTVGALAGPLGAAKAPQIAEGLLTMQANAAAPRVLRKESGMFIGPGAKTWDAEAAKKAQTLAAKGVDPRQIWQETGTFKGPDGAWRQEIPDNTAQVNDPKFWSWGNREGIKSGETAIGPTSEFMLHGQLRDAYPDGLMDFGPNGGKRMVVRVSPRQTSAASYADGVTPDDWGHINVGLEGSGVNKSSMLHEIQHAIQGREGWAQGGSSRMMGDEMGKLRQLDDQFNQAFEQFLNTSDDVARANAKQQMDFYGKKIEPLRDLRGVTTPEEAYTRLAGEAEARATQARMNMNMAQRREVFPLDSWDVPLDQLIVRRGLLDEPAMAIDPKAQKKLVDGLLGQGNTDRYRLGDVLKQQADELDNFNGLPSRGKTDVFVAPKGEKHVKDGRIIKNGLRPELIGTTARQSLEKTAQATPAATRSDYPALVGRKAIDPKTGKVYTPTMPLRPTDDGFEVVTIIPKGLSGKK